MGHEPRLRARSRPILGVVRILAPVAGTSLNGGTPCPVCVGVIEWIVDPGRRLDRARIQRPKPRR